MSQIPNIPDMTTLVECMQNLKKEGYAHEFDVQQGKLVESHSKESFSADDIAVDNFYRFEGASNPSDNSILYAISTATGMKGILVDAYGTYSDEATEDFFKHVAKMTKKVSG